MVRGSFASARSPRSSETGAVGPLQQRRRPGDRSVDRPVPVAGTRRRKLVAPARRHHDRDVDIGRVLAPYRSSVRRGDAKGDVQPRTRERHGGRRPSGAKGLGKQIGEGRGTTAIDGATIGEGDPLLHRHDCQHRHAHHRRDRENREEPPWLQNELAQAVGLCRRNPGGWFLWCSHSPRAGSGEDTEGDAGLLPVVRAQPVPEALAHLQVPWFSCPAPSASPLASGWVVPAHGSPSGGRGPTWPSEKGYGTVRPRTVATKESS